jgi:hypothetical protein
MAGYAPDRNAVDSAAGRGGGVGANDAGDDGDANLPNRPQTMDDRRNLRHEYRGLIDKITSAPSAIIFPVHHTLNHRQAYLMSGKSHHIVI